MDKPKIPYYSPELIATLKRNSYMSPETWALVNLHSCSGGKD